MNETGFRAALRNEANAGRRLDMIRAALCPPEPQLLDTCIVQNLDWVDRQLEAKTQLTWDHQAIQELTRKYGAELAQDLIDLGTLYKTFEDCGGYPWLICDRNFQEASNSSGVRRSRLESMLRFFEGHNADVSSDTYPGVSVGLLRTGNLKHVSPMLLKGIGITHPEEMFSERGPLSFLPDEGDRIIAGYAIFANVRVALTTDRSTFWRHRALLGGFGLTIMRPAELLRLYEPYWEALAGEFERRRADGGPHT